MLRHCVPIVFLIIRFARVSLSYMIMIPADPQLFLHQAVTDDLSIFNTNVRLYLCINRNTVFIYNFGAIPKNPR